MDGTRPADIESSSRVSWGTLGAHLATAKGARGARVVS